MKTTLEVIGPQEAQKILAQTRDNRPVRRAAVMHYADMMRRGQWGSTHQGIAIDKDGYLIDGQHRMLAVIESGKHVGILVSRGLDKGAYRVIDSGLSRTIGDRLKLLNDPKANQVACSLVRSYIIVTQPRPKGGRISVDLVDNLFLTMADEFTEVAMRFKKGVPGLTRSDVGSAIVCYWSKHPDKAEEFLEAFLSGEGMRKGEPAMVLREALFARRIGTGQIHEAYWKAISSTKAHFDGKDDMRMLPTALSDWRNNTYQRAFHEKARSADKGWETRKREQILGTKADEQVRLIASRKNGSLKTA